MPSWGSATHYGGGNPKQLQLSASGLGSCCRGDGHCRSPDSYNKSRPWMSFVNWEERTLNSAGILLKGRIRNNGGSVHPNQSAGGNLRVMFGPVSGRIRHSTPKVVPTRTASANASILPPFSPSSSSQIVSTFPPSQGIWLQFHYAAAVVSCGRPVLPGP